MIALSAGARPVATARSSIAGFRPSMTARTSLDGVATGAGLPEDAEPRVLLALAPAAAGEQPHDEADRDHADRRDDDRQRGEHDGDAFGVERQRGGRLAVEAPADPAEQAAHRGAGQPGEEHAADQPRPPHGIAVVERGG